MKISNFFQIVFIVFCLILFSCKKKSTEFNFNKTIKIYDKTGKLKKVSVKIKDTLITGKLYNLNFSVLIDDKTNIIETGKFVNKYRIGKHLYYQHNNLIMIKYYVFFSKEDLNFLKKTNVFQKHYTENFNYNLPYLNNKLLFRNNGKDTLFCQSTFRDIQFKSDSVKAGDSLKVKITCYDSDYQISDIYLYFNIPEDNQLVDIVQIPGNICYYSHKTKIKGKNLLSGFIILKTFKTDSQNNMKFAFKVYKINKEYTVY